MRPLNASQTPFCKGKPGAMKRQAIQPLRAQAKMALEANSVPCSETIRLRGIVAPGDDGVDLARRPVHIRRNALSQVGARDFDPLHRERRISSFRDAT